jgi:hypothetical protein
MDVLRELLVLLSKGGHITRASDSLLSMGGVPYYSIEITIGNGKRFALQAYGEEATLLHEEVKRIRATEKRPTGEGEKISTKHVK